MQHASNQDGAGKLGLAIDTVEASQARTMHTFIADMQALSAQRMQRGADDILGMSESEWAALFEDEPDDPANPG